MQRLYKHSPGNVNSKPHLSTASHVHLEEDKVPSITTGPLASNNLSEYCKFYCGPMGEISHAPIENSLHSFISSTYMKCNTYKIFKTLEGSAAQESSFDSTPEDAVVELPGPSKLNPQFPPSFTLGVNIIDKHVIS